MRSVPWRVALFDLFSVSRSSTLVLLSFSDLTPATAILAHPWPPDRSLAAVPADLAANQAPSIGLLVALVALAAKLFRISHKHRLNRRNPGLQAQAVETTLELLKPSITTAVTPACPSPAPYLGSSSSIRHVSSWRRSPRPRFAIRNLKPSSGLRRSTPASLFQQPSGNSAPRCSQEYRLGQPGLRATGLIRPRKYGSSCTSLARVVLFNLAGSSTKQSFEDYRPLDRHRIAIKHGRLS